MTDIKNTVENATGKVVDAANTEAPYVNGFFARHPYLMYCVLGAAAITVFVALFKVVL
jgi:hypothetical protein